MSQRASELAQALCSDAHLYGGNPCLCCQRAARRLAEGTSGEDGGELLAGRAIWTTRVESPSHGMSFKTAESRWALVLSNIRRDVRLAAQESEFRGDTW